MNLDQASAFAQIVGVLAVLASLIFVGVQIRQNTLTARAQVHQQLSDSFTGYLATLASHARIVNGASAGSDAMKRLTDEELLTFSFLMAGLFKIWENAFYQNKSGFLDRQAWQSNVKWLTTWYNLPGVRTWWGARKILFAGEFQAFVEAIPVQDDQRGIAEQLRSGWDVN